MWPRLKHKGTLKRSILNKPLSISLLQKKTKKKLSRLWLLLFRAGARKSSEVPSASPQTCLVPFFHVGASTLPLFPPSKWAVSKVNYPVYPMCKKPICDLSPKGSKRTIGLASYGRSKITLIFRIWCVARLWRDQRLVSLEKKMRNVVFKSTNNVWLMWPIYD